MISSLHGLYGLTVHTNEITPAVHLDGIGSMGIEPDTNVNREMTSGSPYPRFQSVNGQEITAQFSTMAIAAALDLIGALGIKITSAAGPPVVPGVVLYSQKWDEANAGRAAGSVHRSYTIAAGVVVPRTLTVDHQGDAALRFDVIMKSTDGTNAPYVVSGTAALPALPGDNERFTLHSTTVAGTALDSVKNIEFDFGITVVPESAESQIWPTFLSITEIQPTITFQGVNLTWADDAVIPLLGKTGTHANTTIFLRKRAEGGTGFVDNATAEHIKATADGLITVESAANADGNSPAECSIRMDCKFDGTNVPISFTTNTAIS